jgi:prepilin-type processing-associated H-X9-DG protein
MMYVQDYDELYPLAFSTDASNNRVDWRVTMLPYIKNGNVGAATTTDSTVIGGIFSCPSTASNAKRVYGAHSAIIHNPRTNNGNTWAPVSLAALNRAADIVLIAEVGVGTDNNGSIEGITEDFWWHAGADASTWPNLNFTGPNSGAKFDADGNCATCNAAGWSQVNTYMPRYRHNGVANMSFADGHAKAFAKGRLNYCTNILFPGMIKWFDNGAQDWLYTSGNPCQGQQQ